MKWTFQLIKLSERQDLDRMINHLLLSPQQPVHLLIITRALQNRRPQHTHPRGLSKAQGSFIKYSWLWPIP